MKLLTISKARHSYWEPFVFGESPQQTMPCYKHTGYKLNVPLLLCKPEIDSYRSTEKAT